CCTVMEANSDLGVFRNGPPEAVSQMRSTSLACPSIRPPRRHWWTALCSLSIGSSALPCFRASAVINSPATTMHSLLARPTVFPARSASYGADRVGIPLLGQRENAGLPAHGLLKSQFGIVAGG